MSRRSHHRLHYLIAFGLAKIADSCSKITSSHKKKVPCHLKMAFDLKKTVFCHLKMPIYMPLPFLQRLRNLSTSVLTYRRGDPYVANRPVLFETGVRPLRRVRRTLMRR